MAQEMRDDVLEQIQVSLLDLILDSGLDPGLDPGLDQIFTFWLLQWTALFYLISRVFFVFFCRVLFRRN